LISCYPCRGRKLKCDGKKPCEQCVRRGSEGHCSYATHVRRRGKGKKPDSEGSSEPDSARDGVDMERDASSSSGGGARSGSGDFALHVPRGSQEPSIAEEMDEDMDLAGIKRESDVEEDPIASSRSQLTSSPVVECKGRLDQICLLRAGGTSISPAQHGPEPESEQQGGSRGGKGERGQLW